MMALHKDKFAKINKWHLLANFRKLRPLKSLMRTLAGYEKSPF